MSTLGSFLAGAAVGANVMYVLDPNRGKSRRALVRDKIVRAIHVSQREAGKQLRNAAHHLFGRLLELRSSVHDSTSEIPDDIVLDRVRAQLGRDVRHMGMLEFRVEDGCVIVEGQALRGEAKKIHDRMHKTRGVRDCDIRVEEISRDEMKRLTGRRGTPPQKMAM